MNNKTVGALYRGKIVDEIKNNCDSCQACLILGFTKINAFAFNTLRNELKKLDATVFVSKNTLIKKALNDLGRQDYEDMSNSSTGLVFTGEEVVNVCKTLIDFVKENEEGLKIKGGYIKDKKLNPAEISTLASLPPKEVLLSQAIHGMISPLTGFLAAMNQVILKFVWTVEEIKKKKST